MFHCSVIKVLLPNDSSDILSYRLKLVKNFFKKFFQGFCLFATAMIDYHIFKALSRTFFQKFSAGGSFTALPFSNFDMLPYPEVFVNNFFEVI